MNRGLVGLVHVGLIVGGVQCAQLVNVKRSLDMINLDYGGRAVRGRLKQERAIAALPARAVEADQGRVYAHVAPALVDLVHVARAGLRHERYPAGELPLHFDVKVRRLLQPIQELGYAVRAAKRALILTICQNELYELRVSRTHGLLNHLKW